MTDRDKAVKEFLADLVEVCKKHGFTLSHEDSQGALLVYTSPPDKYDIEWLSGAHVKELTR